MYSGKSGCKRARWFYLFQMVVFGKKWFSSGKSSCIPAKVVVFWQKCLISEVLVVIGQRWLYSSKSGCFQAKWLLLRKKWLYSDKVIVFSQSRFIRTKVVVFGQSGFIRANWWYSASNRGIIVKLVVFGQKLFYWGKGL